MPIKDEIEYQIAKIMLDKLYPKRNNSPEDSDNYYLLLSDVTEYEIKTGKTTKNE